MITKDLILVLTGLVSCVLLLLFAGTKTYRRNPKLRALFALPMVIAVLHIDKTDPEPALIGTYLGCAGLAFMAVTEKHKNAVAALCSAAIFSSAVICPLDPDYRIAGYEKEFKSCFEQLRRNYVLTEHKNIDWDELYERFVPMFREADRTRDEALCYEAGRQFAMAFHDGHVNFSYGIDEEDGIKFAEQYDRSHCGEDYGFAMLRMSGGRVAAVNVDEGSEAYRAGIRNGTEITAIDGESIEDVVSGAYVWFSNFPDRDNESFYAPLAALSAKSGEITVSFRDETGDIMNAELTANGSFYDRFRSTLRIVDSEEAAEVNNFRYYMADENTGCLVLNGMEMDEDVMVSSETREWIREKYPEEEEPEWLNTTHGEMKMQLWYEIEKLREQGAEDLIIDMRNNHGGLINIADTIASLFTSEEIFLANEGKLTPEGYSIADTRTVQPDNKWGSGQIVILVNNNSASAAELFARCMAQLDNVTVMGLTKSYGCGQATVPFGSGKMLITGSVILVLDEAGEIMIDSASDRLNRYSPDIIIPFDEAAVDAIFTEKTDYVLNCAKEFLN